MWKSDALNLAKSAVSKVKQYALNLSEIELKVEEATNNDAWGPHGSVMAGELCQTHVPWQEPYN